jgi:hypothetical protein
MNRQKEAPQIAGSWGNSRKCLKKQEHYSSSQFDRKPESPELTAPSLPPLPKPSWWNRVSSYNRYARDLELNPDAQSTRDSFHAIEKTEQAEGYE